MARRCSPRTNKAQKPNDGPSRKTSLTYSSLTSTSTVGSVVAECSLSPGPNYAHYDDKRGLYVCTSTGMTSQDPFSVETTTIDSGPYKGHQALVLVPVPQQTFPFFDLPAEIRLLVYRELFTKDGHDMLVEGVKGKLRFSWQKPLDDGGGDTTKPSNRQSLPSSALLVDRRFHAEAAAVVYGANNLRFPTTVVMKLFLDHIGPDMRALLGSVELARSSGYMTKSARAAGNLLADASRLRRLHLDVHRSRGRRWPAPRDIVRDFGPVYEAAFRRKGDVFEVMKVVTFGAAAADCGMRRYFHDDPDDEDEECRDCLFVKKCNREFDLQLKIKVSMLVWDSLQGSIDRSKAVMAQMMEDTDELTPARRDTGRPKRQTVLNHPWTYDETLRYQDDDLEEDE